MNDLKGVVMWLLDMVTSIKEKVYAKLEPRKPYPCITCLFNEDGTPSGLTWNGQKQEDAFDLEKDEQEKEGFWLRMQLRLILWLRKNAD